jgi:VanZ family protein
MQAGVDNPLAASVIKGVFGVELEMAQAQLAENVNLIPGNVDPDGDFATRWIPTILWVSMLCIFSTTYFTSNNTGAVITAILHWISPTGPLLIEPALANVIARKGAHFSLYVGFFLILIHGPLKGRPWVALLICVIAGTMDETHQLLLPGRTPTVFDIAIDSSGAFFGCFMNAAVNEVQGTA